MWPNLNCIDTGWYGRKFCSSKIISGEWVSPNHSWVTSPSPSLHRVDTFTTTLWGPYSELALFTSTLLCTVDFCVVPAVFSFGGYLWLSPFYSIKRPSLDSLSLTYHDQRAAVPCPFWKFVSPLSCLSCFIFNEPCGIRGATWESLLYHLQNSGNYSQPRAFALLVTPTRISGPCYRSVKVVMRLLICTAFYYLVRSRLCISASDTAPEKPSATVDDVPQDTSQTLTVTPCWNMGFIFLLS